MKVACLSLLIQETSSLLKGLIGKKYLCTFESTILRLNAFKYKIVFCILIHLFDILPIPAGDPSDLGITSYTKLREGNVNTQTHIVTGPLSHVQKLNMDRQKEK